MIRLNPQRRTVLTFAKRGHFFKTDKCHKLQLRSNCQNILGLSNIMSNTVKKNNVENTEWGAGERTLQWLIRKIICIQVGDLINIIKVIVKALFILCILQRI